MPPTPARSKPKAEKPGLVERTPVAEWVAATLGLLLTTLVVGHALWEGLSQNEGAPDLRVRAAPPAAVPGGWRVVVTVRNQSHQTASAVEVSGVVARLGQPEEDASTTFDYVPAKGEVTGGLMFRSDPRGALQVSISGYAIP